MLIQHCERRRKHGAPLVTNAPHSLGFRVFSLGRACHFLNETCLGPVPLPVAQAAFSCPGGAVAADICDSQLQGRGEAAHYGTVLEDVGLISSKQHELAGLCWECSNV